MPVKVALAIHQKTLNLVSFPESDVINVTYLVVSVYNTS